MLEQIERYLHHLRAERHASEHTLRGYRSDLRELCAFLAGARDDRSISPRSVSAADLRAYAAAKLRGARRSTVSRKVSAVRGFFAFLLARGTLRKDPAAQLVAPKIEKRLPVFLPIDATGGLLNGWPAGEPCRDGDPPTLQP